MNRQTAPAFVLVLEWRTWLPGVVVETVLNRSSDWLATATPTRGRQNSHVSIRCTVAAVSDCSAHL